MGIIGNSGSVILTSSSSGSITCGSGAVLILAVDVFADVFITGEGVFIVDILTTVLV